MRRGILLCVTWLGAVAAVTFVSLSLASGGRSAAGVARASASAAAGH